MNQRGMVMALSLGVVTLLATLGAAFLMRSLNEAGLSRRVVDRQAAFYMAEGALDQAIVNLRANNSAAIPSTVFVGGTYWTDITSLGPLTYRLNAHGRVGSAQRDLEAVMRLTAQSALRYPLFGKHSVELKKGAFTDSYNSSLAPYDPNHPGQHGDVATNGTAAQSIRLQKGTAVNGQVIVGPGMADPSTAVESDGTAVITGTPTIVSSSQTLVVSPVDTTGMSCSGNLDLPKNATFTFDASGSPYCFNHITADQGSVMSVSGNVKVYAKSVDFDKELQVNAGGNPPQFLLYIYGTSDVVIDKEGTFVGVIYAPEARVRLKKEVEFSGALMAKDVEIDKESKFHYDEALQAADGPVGGYEVSVQSWLEP